jgi:hypothetical protein
MPRWGNPPYLFGLLFHADRRRELLRSLLPLRTLQRTDDTLGSGSGREVSDADAQLGRVVFADL